MYRPLRLFLLVTIGSWASHSGLLGGVEVIFQVNTESKAIIHGVGIEPPSIRLYELRIENTWLEFDQGPTTVIMDRDGDRVITLNPAKGEYESNSLFALFEFRADAYRAVLSSENLGYRPDTYGTAVPEILVDHIFSISDPESVQKPEFKDVEHERQWFSGNMRLAEWTKEGNRLSEAHLSNFLFWVRQTLGGHPQILQNLLEGGVLPDRWEMVLNNGRTTKAISIEVVGLRKIPDVSLESRLGGMSLHSTGAEIDTLVALLDWVRGGTEFSESLRTGGKASAAAAADAFEKGDPIRGILQLIRTQMTTGESPEVELERYGQEIKASRTAANLLVSLNAKTSEQSEKAIQTFDVLSTAFEDQAPVLNVLSADTLARMGRMASAEAFYRKAILSDPGLAVAYKSLGDIYRSTSRYSQGWMCYDTLEIVAPDHPVADAVREMRKIMLEDFPDFF